MKMVELRSILERTLQSMPAHADELRKLDAALGDGDLGITVSAGSSASREAIFALPQSADASELLMAVGKAFSTANPSTFAALIGGGLLAAAKTVHGNTALDRADAIAIGDAVATRIAERGKAQLGDKTVLDALIPSLENLRGNRLGSPDSPNPSDSPAPDAAEVLDAMIATSHAQIDATTGLQSAKGRAAWVQERSVGHPDPGAVAYLRFLQELRTHWSR
ncbi:MAG: DAK2 domain-containing protein [Microbacteriaceae bacterium]